MMVSQLPAPRGRVSLGTTRSTGAGWNLGDSMSSLTSCTQESNPSRITGLVTVILIVLILWPAAAEAVGTYANALALTTVLAGGGAAAAYRNHSSRT